jgi:hypothetical protein
MENKPKLESITTLSDDELLRRLSELLSQSRRVESELVAHIGEVDARGLYARKGSSSMFVYCREILHLSEHEAYLRINVARASRKHPMLLDMLGDGRLHLSGIAKLAPMLTEENRETLLARATHQSKRQIDELVAELSPKPDVPPSMRELPKRPKKTEPNSKANPNPKPEPKSELGPDRVAASMSAPAPAKPPVVEPIAPERYKIQFTASAELRDKLERLKALMRSSVPDGDLAAIIEEAVTEKLERLESKRYAKTKAPRKGVEEADPSPSSRYIPAPVRRAVYERDNGQCTFVGDNGRRCTERDRLEFHHHKPYGQGGDCSLENIRLACRAHDRYLAERDYGREVMARYRSPASHVREPSIVYHLDWRAVRAP